MSVKVTYIHEYYDSSFARKVSHLSKEGDPFAVIAAVEQLANLIPVNATLIPVPSRHGYADQTLHLAERIAQIVGCRVADVIKGSPRISLYEAKKSGSTLNVTDFNFSLLGDPGEVPVIIDFVFATGTTVAAIIEHIPKANVVVLTRDSTVQLIDDSIFEFQKSSLSHDDDGECDENPEIAALSGPV